MAKRIRITRLRRDNGRIVVQRGREGIDFDDIGEIREFIRENRAEDDDDDVILACFLKWLLDQTTDIRDMRQLVQDKRYELTFTEVQ